MERARFQSKPINMRSIKFCVQIITHFERRSDCSDTTPLWKNLKQFVNNKKI